MDQMHRVIGELRSELPGLSEWWGSHRTAVPALAALLVIVVIGIVGVFGGLRYLQDTSSPTAILGGLYLMLAVIGVSVVVAVVAVNHLIEHFARSKEPLD